MQALARANEVRLARAALKRNVAAGHRGVTEVILDGPWEAQSMSLSELLCSQRRWGRARSRKLLASAGLNEAKRLGTLTARQQRILVGALEAKLARPDLVEGTARAAAERRRAKNQAEPPKASAPAAAQIAGCSAETPTKSPPKTSMPTAPPSRRVWLRYPAKCSRAESSSPASDPSTRPVPIMIARAAGDEEPTDEHDQRDQDDQLGEQERAPGRWRQGVGVADRLGGSAPFAGCR